MSSKSRSKDMLVFKKMTVRWVDNKKRSIEVTVPQVLRGTMCDVGDELTPVYAHGVLLYLPEGKWVDPDKLREAIIDVKEE